jgi:Transposase, Mutator family/Streptomycin adenylyltransferase
VNVHALLATGVNGDGYREILGLHVTSAEDGAGWLGFLRDLVACGLSGVALVTSDAHRGLIEAIGATLPGASWQRCRTHCAANLMAATPKNAWGWVKALLHSVMTSPTPTRCTGSSTASLTPWPTSCQASPHHLDQARADILAFTAFPKAAWRQIWSKDGLTTDLAAPTFGSYIPARPDEATYLLITDFLIGVPYVAKSLLRGQLLPAKWALDFDMRFNYLIPLLEWRAECDHDWSLEPGNLGKGLVAHLPADTWRELERTFTGADPKANWEALFEMIALFDRVAREVADLLDYTHPEISSTACPTTPTHARGRFRRWTARRRVRTRVLAGMRT